MLRTTRIYNIDNSAEFKTQLLVWAQQFNDVVWLDSNMHSNIGHKAISRYDALLAVDAFTAITTEYRHAFETLKRYQTHTNDWIFGYLSYDLKNDIEALFSKNHDGLSFADLHFFQPKKLFLIRDNLVEMHYLHHVADQSDKDFNTITSLNKPDNRSTAVVKIKSRIPKESYVKKVQSILDYLRHGAVYEVNFCQEFYAEHISINPLETYLKLNAISNPPFASFVKFTDTYVMSASPERYIKKTGTTIISQPIKGTAKRSKNSAKDNKLKHNLYTDEKERSENIMIVDLVRNDLSKTAIKGSVMVRELCKVYTFDQVHQMISTITSQVNEATHPVDVIKSTFPMGSMTGAPKISAMQIIEELEMTKRGVYSGAIGYITPNGDFDFNVVIRSILYNAKKQYVSCSVGSAITAKSDPLREYDECLVKAKAMREVLEH